MRDHRGVEGQLAIRDRRDQDQDHGQRRDGGGVRRRFGQEQEEQAEQRQESTITIRNIE